MDLNLNLALNVERNTWKTFPIHMGVVNKAGSVREAGGNGFAVLENEGVALFRPDVLGFDVSKPPLDLAPEFAGSGLF